MEKLRKINIKAFFNSNHQRLNNGKGISGTGIITPSKMLNVLNLTAKDRDTGQLLPGTGKHPDTIKAILKEIYGEDIYSRVPDIEDRVIRIIYVNEDRGEGEQRFAIIQSPAYINPFQIGCLRNICSTILSIDEPPHIGGIVYSIDPRKDKNEGIIIPNRLFQYNFGYDIDEETLEDEEKEEILKMLDILSKDCKNYGEFIELDDMIKD